MTGEGFAFFCWYRLRYLDYSQWHKGRVGIWYAWWGGVR